MENDLYNLNRSVLTHINNIRNRIDFEYTFENASTLRSSCSFVSSSLWGSDAFSEPPSSYGLNSSSNDRELEFSPEMLFINALVKASLAF